MIKLAKVTKTKRDEEKWEKAVGIAAKAGKKENYAYIMGIYKKMNPDYEFKNASLLQRYVRAGIQKRAFQNDLPSHTFPAKVTEIQEIFMPYLCLDEVDKVTGEVTTFLTDTTGHYYDSLEEFESVILQLLGPPETQHSVKDLGNGFLEYSSNSSPDKTAILTVNLIIDFIGTMPINTTHLERK